MVPTSRVITVPMRLVIQIPLPLRPSARLIFQSLLRGQMGKGHSVVVKGKSGGNMLSRGEGTLVSSSTTRADDGQALLG